MKLRTIVITAIAAFLAVTVTSRGAGAGQAENYPVLAYAVPTDQSLISMRAAAPRMVYLSEDSLFSSSTLTVRTEEGFIVQWRERVFASIAANMTPDTADGERMVERIAVKESVKLALQHLPALDRLIKALKFEVSTDMLARSEEKDESDAAPDISPAPVARQAVKERFFMKTGLRIPVEGGKPAILSETDAVYGGFTTYFNVRLDSKRDSSLGIRYKLDRDMQVQLEHTTADAADPASGAARRSAQNLLKLVCAF